MRRGTGLGMPLVKSLVQQMSGEITVESAVGKGSRFTVTLPLEVRESMTILVKPRADLPAGMYDDTSRHRECGSALHRV